MPTRVWFVDATRITLVDRGDLGITLRVGDEQTAIPPRTIGAWPVRVPDREVRLEARRNLDALRFFVIADGHPVPRGEVPLRAPPPGARCDRHGQPAVCRCARCETVACRTCAPSGRQCAACLDALAVEERARILKVRRWVVAACLAAGLVAAVVGVAVSLPLAEAGTGVVVITLAYAVRGALGERRERRLGIAPAVDVATLRRPDPPR